ncbi:NADH-quinone oxidoreductase subunit J [Ereboglobus sp. PH5-10]|uniref:NADH-quinone oxidoreductase subunit J family protein n=1 Tax=Ereboglobus sp. PH5-10 TaxID=2940629 RepID=UPI0024073338|nr:NADH-quinone oxidoreductase subunit J [Ereboglobus sp. PH5-10]MDF9825946.1 NADH-quinone oxidoreductase subunit J [Ereboglobus sp. PH5-10]
MPAILFYIFSALTLAAAIGLVANRNAVASALSFFVCLCGISVLFVMLDAHLLAFLLILVYAGAVVALFLFIIMLLDMHGGKRPPFKKMTIVASSIAGALLIFGAFSFFARGQFSTDELALAQAPAFFTDLKIYGAKLFTTYMLPVQLVGFLLLVGMLGVIVISKKHEEKEPGDRIQEPGDKP